MSEFKEVVKDGAQEIGKKAWRGTKRVLLFALVLGVLILAVYTGFNYAWTYSDGTRSGILIKVSKKGYVFKTYEGQLNAGGLQANQQGQVIGNLWEFSVTSDEVYQKLQSYEGKQVILHYEQYRKAFPWQGKTTYFVDEVKPVQ